MYCFNVLIVNFFKKPHGYYPDENPNTNRTVDFLRNRPQVEEMSEEVRQEQLKELGMSKKEYQQMQQDGWNFKGTGHWEFTGDRLVEIPSAIKIHIKRLSAPKYYRFRCKRLRCINKH